MPSMRNWQTLKLSSYAAAVFQVMTEKTGLTEGFMPLPAKKSRKSKEILKYVKYRDKSTKRATFTGSPFYILYKNIMNYFY